MEVKSCSGQGLIFNVVTAGPQLAARLVFEYVLKLQLNKLTFVGTKRHETYINSFRIPAAADLVLQAALNTPPGLRLLAGSWAGLAVGPTARVRDASPD